MDEENALFAQNVNFHLRNVPEEEVPKPDHIGMVQPFEER